MIRQSDEGDGTADRTRGVPFAPRRTRRREVRATVETEATGGSVVRDRGATRANGVDSTRRMGEPARAASASIAALDRRRGRDRARRRGRRSCGAAARNPAVRSQNRRNKVRARCPSSSPTARTGDMRVYLDGLGTVTPLQHRHGPHARRRPARQGRFQEGQLVKEGDLLAEIDPRPFQVQLAQAQGAAREGPGAARRTRASTSSATRLQARTDRPSSSSTRRPRPLRSTKARSRVDQGQIDSAKLQLTYCRITAPISGRIGLRLVDQGNIVHATDPNGLVVITQLAADRRRVHVPQDDLPRCTQQTTGRRRCAVEAYDREHVKTKLATGTLLAIDNQIDPTTGTVPLKAHVRERGHALFPNQFVNARLLVDTKTRRRCSSRPRPCSGARRRTFVYVVKPDDDGRGRSTVTLGPTERRHDVAIASGLAAGERRRDRRRRQAQGRREDRGAPTGAKNARRSPATARTRNRVAADGARRRAQSERREGRRESVPAVHPAAGRDVAADGRDPAGRASSPTGSCRSRRCRRSTIRRSRSSRSIPARART